ncbi:MAG: hypothetical protein HY057_15010 [Rhodospirillales bacterium]|nr:hypothetical protein [Rhodospirillales bacterium]
MKLTRAPVIPKVREHAQITMTDGTTLNGYMFVEATSRIQDVLNDTAPFFAFVDSNDEILLINKSAVVRVRPHDNR